jgi:CBS domain-containing protein
MLEQIASLTMAQIPSRPPVLVPRDARLGDVVATMRNQRQGAACVVDRIIERHELVGIFTERDLLRRVDHRTLAWRDEQVHTVMTARPMIIREDDTIAEALRRMDVGKRRHLPVMRGREPIAIVSVRDVLAFLASKFPADFLNLPPDPRKEARAPWGG